MRYIPNFCDRHRHYIVNVVQGDFGTSMVSRRPVVEEIASRFMPTFWLTITSMVWAMLFGLGAGIIAAVWRNRWPDRLGMALAVTGISFPAFALGMLLMQIFSVELGWLPTVGADTWKHYVLPSVTLGAAVAAVMARFTRASFVDVLNEDYMRTARAKGVSEKWVILKHGLRNAMIPVGMILWTAVLKSGVHATLAGVIVGFFVPLRPQDGKSPAKQLEHVLHPWVAFNGDQ
jgi:glutathione transport system permease protein